MRSKRGIAALAVTGLLTFGFSVAVATPAFAAVPSNDTIQTATEITSVPFTDTVDTTEATTDALETSLNQQCGAPKAEHGVWYHATAAETGLYTADVTQSSYSAGIMAVQGPIDSPTVLQCGPGKISGPLTAGQDVFILVFGDGGATGSDPTSGTMVLNVTETPLPTVNLTVDGRGSFNHGSVTISGTISCTGAGVSADIFGQVSQRVGRALYSSFFDTQPAITCDGTAQPWSGTAPPQNGLFGGGKANVDVQANVCDSNLNCGSAEVVTSVQLSGGKK